MSNVYEPGMTITYDASSKRVVIAFRGRIAVLPGTFDTEAMGKAAAETHCMKLGWNPANRAERNGGRLRTVF